MVVPYVPKITANGRKTSTPYFGRFERAGAAVFAVGLVHLQRVQHVKVGRLHADHVVHSAQPVIHRRLWVGMGGSVPNTSQLVRNCTRRISPQPPRAAIGLTDTKGSVRYKTPNGNGSIPWSAYVRVCECVLRHIHCSIEQYSLTVGAVVHICPNVFTLANVNCSQLG